MPAPGGRRRRPRSGRGATPSPSPGSSAPLAARTTKTRTVDVLPVGQGVLAGTLIASEMGERPVEEVTVGQRIYGRGGLAVVTAAGPVTVPRAGGLAPALLVVTFSDQRTLVATPDLKLYIHDHAR